MDVKAGSIDDRAVHWTSNARSVKSNSVLDPISEDGLAESFCVAHPRLRYVAAWGQWMAWTGTQWDAERTLGVFDLIRTHVRLVTDRDPDWSKASVVSAVERLAKADRKYAATVDQWDVDDMQLNTPTGIVDLSTGKVLPSDPLAYLTKQTGTAIGGGCPTWLKFLSEVTNGDQQYIAFLQRGAGYCATGSTQEHALFFLWGSGGNGKGVFLNTLVRVLGDYAVTASMETFTESTNDRHPTDLAMLRGARLVVAQETEEGRSWAESRIKAITGGDPITARFMKQDFFTFQPKFKLVIAGNHKPRLRNVDEAMRRRLHLLPFTQSFNGVKRDPRLSESLMAESGGILQWILDGALAYQREGLAPPPVVTQATSTYFEAENLFEQWLTDCCEVGTTRWERPSTLFNSWKRYAEAANIKPGNQNSFADRLENAGFVAGNSSARGGRYRDGLSLKSDQTAQSH